MKHKPVFSGNVIVQWLADGRAMELLEDFSFVDAKGTSWPLRLKPYTLYLLPYTVFCQAMRTDKTPKAKAKEMYKAVRMFGPRWDEDGNLLEIRIDSDELYL